MVEKRPAAEIAAGDAKRAKGADAIAAAKAKAAEIAARLAARKAGAPPAAAPAPAAASSDTQDRLAALKARMAAMKADKAPAKPDPSEPSGPRFATTLGNRRSETPIVDTKSKPVVQKAKETQDEASFNPYFDPHAASQPGARTRVSKPLHFNEHGKYLDQASKLRAQGRLEQIKKMLAKQARRAGLDENSERGFMVEQPPDIEWWDEGILKDKTYDCIDDPEKVMIDTDDSIITLYVQHPPLLKAPQDNRLIEVKPLYLTTKEQAKARRMRRKADHEEMQAKIRLGLEPPPPPKVKRGNMMRVMGEQAIADPTAVEMLVEQQIAQRQNDHEAANEDRKLTDEQRHAKLERNQEKDAQKGLYLCVFKVNTLAYGKHRYQIDMNAKQHALTGLTLFNPDLNLIIVEGGLHSIEKYKKLLLQRIKWSENAEPTEIQIEKTANDPQWMKSLDANGNLKDHSQNKCTLLFEGEVKNRAFRKWGSKMCETAGEAREILSRSKLDSLWALAKSVD
ncbi:pre-mRNA processing factor 3-domain-containing protein [Boeremia exigua]|uniref:pre-mRNA processing factor 3-domain-containing protein n=1 Tax=Boeremia exigua TaxID=749465 RepID=UPI001E8EC615|nr:pre-mRNA processing factor 3-domain-containing protein [Boeremia exigua]KAH6644358.1 pre-mRNA processing factor 3-domain-containing protein [Boeremia exigua]